MINKIKNKKMRTNKGITLIALVITIIVLLILAAVSIATLTGENGILTQAGNSKTDTEKGAAKEKVQVEVLGSYGNDGNLDYTKLKSNLDKITGIEGVPDTITAESFTLKVTVDGYEVLVSEDGKVSVPIKSGDKATATVKDNYTDGSDTATIPAGFTVSSIDNTVSTGLVVIGPDESEFVWVPVNNINDMAQCSTAGGECNLELDTDGHLRCTIEAHSTTATEIVGKLYATSTGENFGTENTTYNADSGLREPAIVTENNDGTGTSFDGQYYSNAGYGSASAMLDGLKSEYKLMAESVAKYGGFYVGRYEASLSDSNETTAATTGNIQSKAGVLPTSAKNSATNMWYGLYSKAKTYTANSIQSSMIWGSQYDAMLNWVKNGNGADKDKVTTRNIGGNYSGSVTTTGNASYANDSINKIRDLGGNLREWTLGAYGTNSRVLRGGYYDNSRSPSSRDNDCPNYTSVTFGSRLTLYIQ